MKNIGAIVAIGALACGLAAPVAAQEKMDLKTLLARHAQSLRKAETPALQSRRVEGSVEMNVVVGGSGTLVGTTELASEGDHRRLGMKFGHGSYDHELVITDGDKISVDQVNASRRSDLGLFLLSQDQVFKEGLFGGALSAAWPLAAGAEAKGKMKYEGVKKVEGRDLHAVSYRTRRKSGDVEIMLYFDPQTYSHVRSTYLVTMRAGITSTPRANEVTVRDPMGAQPVETGDVLSARQQVTRFRLEEDFDDFRNSQGYAVPAQWKIRYTMETQQSRTYEWLVKINDVKNNLPFEAKMFEVK